MLRKLIQAAAILALVTAPASAQMAISPFKGPEKRLTPDELKEQKQREKDYKAAMDKIPEKKVTIDPWGDVRPTPAPQSTAKNKQ
jgi:hypothetical protein